MAETKADRAAIEAAREIHPHEPLRQPDAGRIISHHYAPLVEAAERLAESEHECWCDDHTSENCCNNALGVFCSRCVAAAALDAVRGKK